GMFVVRADSPYHSIEDLKGRPVAFGAKGSGLVILANYVLDGLGYDRDRDFQAILLDRAGDGPALVASGGAAALWGGGSGWPGFTAGAQAPPGAPFLLARSRGIPRDFRQHPLLQALTLRGRGGLLPAPARPIPSGRPRGFLPAGPAAAG